MIYPVAIRTKETDNQHTHFIAIAPDLPELHIEGVSMADVIHNARAVIMAHLQVLAENNQVVRSGQDISVHLNNPDFFGCTWAIISLDSIRFAQAILSYRLNIPKTVLDGIYDVVGEGATGETVDEFIVDAIKQKLKTP